MSATEPTTDAVLELEVALAEADALDPTDDLRSRTVSEALKTRAAGRSVQAVAPPTGLEVFRRTVGAFNVLLGELDRDEWSRRALRDLDVQGLVGHLIGVEEAFLNSLGGTEDPDHAADHIAATQPAAARQAARGVDETRREWFERALASIDAVGELDPATPVSFYGVTLPVDALLVIRSFEMWIHEEDVRRATGRPLDALDPARLSRMTELGVGLLPAGIARANRTMDGRAARLVLTGAGGGTWDVNLDGTAERRHGTTRIVVDATAFCRVVGNRDDLPGSGAIVDGDREVAEAVFAGAATLALD